MTRCLVTGATGFVGRHTVPALLERGFEVHATTSRAEAEVPRGAMVHRVDLLDAVLVEDLLDEVRPTHLLHLAWYVEHGRFWTAPENLDWVAASLHLLRTFERTGGRRALLAGSCAEYDWRYGYCREGITPLVPATLYGTAKAALASVAGGFAAESQLSVAWGRIFFVYGPDEHPGRLVASVIANLLAGREAPVSHGRQIRDYLHAADVAEGFVALLASKLEGPVNVGSGTPVSLREVVTTAARLLDREDLVRFGAVPSAPREALLVVADGSRLASTGWVPRYNLHSGLTHTITAAQMGSGPPA